LNQAIKDEIGNIEGYTHFIFSYSTDPDCK
jgi:hypothetical protein